MLWRLAEYSNISCKKIYVENKCVKIYTEVSTNSNYDGEGLVFVILTHFQLKIVFLSGIKVGFV